MSLGFNKAFTIDVSTDPATRKGKLDSSEFLQGGAGVGIYGGGRRLEGGDTPSKVMVTELDFPTMEAMYHGNVWVRACIDKIVRRATAVKPMLRPILRKPTEKPNRVQRKRMDQIEQLLAVPNDMQESHESILKKIFTDVLIWDAAGLELVGDNSEIDEIYAVSGDTIRKNVDERGIFRSQSRAYIQKENYTGKTVASFAADELCYFMQYPRAKRVYGFSPLESLRQTVTSELYAAEFNKNRFVNDATPRFAMMFENLGMGQGEPAIKRLRQWWDQELKGKPHRPILIGSENGQIKFEKIGLTNEDMQFQEYSRWLLSKIMAVYHMQAAVLGVIEINQGRINASYQEEQFKKDALRPLLQMYSNQFNTLLIWSNSNLGYNDIYLTWEGLDALDRLAEAEIHEIYLRYGVFTINMVLKELGMESVPWGDVPYLLNQMLPIEMHPEEKRETEPGRKPGEKPELSETTYVDENGKLNVEKWLRAGLTKGGLIPTGLERVEKSELKEAISRIKRNRQQIRSAKVIDFTELE